eukprot:gene8328-8414_t
MPLKHIEFISPTQFLNQAIRGLGFDEGFNLQILESDFNQIELQIFDPSSDLYQFAPDIQRKLNYELMVYAAEQPNFYICDISAIQNQVGKSAFFQTSVYINTEMVLSIDVVPLVAAKTIDLIAAMYGKFKKCLIIDLDNTMWGGIIGDDGLENIQIGSLGIGKAFTEFQYWVKKLKNRGIILAICSKNTESIAKEPFENHPDMVLHLDDIAVFVANWDNKADNIKQIQGILNIGFDSMVFLDDNPFERNMVRENLPAVTVPELPEDAADYLEYLYGLNLFETISFSNEDAERTKLYQTEAKRVTLQTAHTNEDDFLKSLNMLSLVEPFNKFNTPRVAQLSQRSNQFNLRTVRYTEQDIELLIQQKNVFTFAFSLEDQFGDNGLISMVVLKPEQDDTLFIDTWLMSCRVLKRGMESFVLNTLAKTAKKEGFNWLKGEYVPTAKNEMVKDHYKNLIELLKQVNDIFIDTLDNEDIVLTYDTTANDVEDWDSLNHIQLVVAIEKHFKIRFTSHEIQSWKNFKQNFQVTDTVYSGFILTFGDKNPLHTDETFAQEKGFKGRVMHGNILNGFISYFVAVVAGKYESVNAVEFKFTFKNEQLKTVWSEANARKIEAEHPNTHGIRCNFKVREDVDLLIKKMDDLKPDVLINNAYSGAFMKSYFHKTGTSEFLEKKKSGKILTVLTSALINVPPLGTAAYVANKAYLSQMSKVWATENAKHNITSNTVSPSFMLTGFTAETDQRVVEQLSENHPLKTILTTQEGK